MKTFISLLSVLFLMISCKDKVTSNKQKLDVWEAFKTNNIEFLLNHSKDTIKCTECGKSDDQVIKQEFFKVYYNNLLLTIKDKEYDVFKEHIDGEEVYIVSYRLGKESIVSRLLNNPNPEVSNLIFIFKEKNDTIKLEEVISVP
ncbi:hypothetical protein UJ101_00275 [Flavobacteriaceae bacterium UJ101]|nr:hypothetical protein UJ101_00275 [Flavobacteriaceae bacterium UJ101]